ncbi:transcriptional regulator [Mangrovactinospora gilvigrisea]|uniref:Transcriptional regulator n=2 Tax=Mangrovactinospora gilvigrisea TaxID=1428644 RepID=A0A1J7BF01_9ACTN|nr:transcriptional regulator [Mangrovactinospora gilvigrisea]
MSAEQQVHDGEPRDEAGARVEKAARGLLRSLGTVSRVLFEAADFGLPRSSLNALDALADGPRRVTELTAPTGLTQPRVTVVLQTLEEAGLVERRRCDEDRRSIRVRITPAGLEVLDRGRQRMAARLLDGLRERGDDPERAVAEARQAVRTLLAALEPSALD